MLYLSFQSVTVVGKVTNRLVKLTPFFWICISGLPRRGSWLIEHVGVLNIPKNLSGISIHRSEMIIAVHHIHPHHLWLRHLCCFAGHLPLCGGLTGCIGCRL